MPRLCRASDMDTFLGFRAPFPKRAVLTEPFQLGAFRRCQRLILTIGWRVLRGLSGGFGCAVFHRRSC